MSDSSPRRMSRHRRAVVYMSAVGIAAAAAVPLATSSSAASLRAGSAVPAAAAHRLSAMALRAARLNGDARPAWIRAVTTTQAKALRVATPGDTVPGSAGRIVYLVVMKGNFTLGGPVPPGGHEPTGHYFSATLDPTTFQTMDLGLGDQAPSVPLRSFGPVSNLMKQK